MDGTIYCFVDRTGNMHIKDESDSCAETAAGAGLNESECQEVRFDLVNRRLLADRETPSSTSPVRAYLADRVGTAERLMRFAAEGCLTKTTLAELLDPELRRGYLDACASIEQAYTAKCADAGDPCLESGCSIDQEAGEICLQRQELAQIDRDFHPFEDELFEDAFL